MKSELQYLMDALDEWNRQHKWERGLPLTTTGVAECLHIADALRTKDREKMEKGESESK